MDRTTFKIGYYAKKHRCLIFCTLFLIAAVFLVLLNISIGEYHIGIAESYDIIIKHITGDTDYSWRDNHVVWDLRLPRAIGTFAIGAILAVSGAAMQSTLKNPLADPYTVGISSGASLGVILAATADFYVVPFVSTFTGQTINAFVFSLLPMAAILIFSYGRKSTPNTVILVGVAVMYIFSAITSALMLIADPEDFAGTYRWALGNIGSIGWDNLGIVVTAAATCTLLMCYFTPIMNILSSDDRSCLSFGVNPKLYRTIILIIASLATAAAVCYTGTIGFVGLIVPHIARMIVGSNNRILIPTCVGLGGVFLLVADSITKVVEYGTLPIGVITAIIGCPMFVYVMMKYRHTKNGF